MSQFGQLKKGGNLPKLAVGGKTESSGGDISSFVEQNPIKLKIGGANEDTIARGLLDRGDGSFIWTDANRSFKVDFTNKNISRLINPIYIGNDNGYGDVVSNNYPYVLVTNTVFNIKTMEKIIYPGTTPHAWGISPDGSKIVVGAVNSSNPTSYESLAVIDTTTGETLFNISIYAYNDNPDFTQLAISNDGYIYMGHKSDSVYGGGARLIQYTGLSTYNEIWATANADDYNTYFSPQFDQYGNIHTTADLSVTGMHILSGTSANRLASISFTIDGESVLACHFHIDRDKHKVYIYGVSSVGTYDMMAYAFTYEYDSSGNISNPTVKAIRVVDTNNIPDSINKVAIYHFNGEYVCRYGNTLYLDEETFLSDITETTYISNATLFDTFEGSISNTTTALYSAADGTLNLSYLNSFTPVLYNSTVEEVQAEYEVVSNIEDTFYATWEEN